MSRKDLIDECRVLGIKGYSKLKVVKLRELIHKTKLAMDEEIDDARQLRRDMLINRVIQNDLDETILSDEEKKDIAGLAIYKQTLIPEEGVFIIKAFDYPGANFPEPCGVSIDHNAIIGGHILNESAKDEINDICLDIIGISESAYSGLCDDNRARFDEIIKSRKGFNIINNKEDQK